MKSIVFYFNSLQPSGGIERVITTLANKFSESLEVTILVKDQATSFYPLNDNVNLVSLKNELKFDMGNKLKRIFSAANSVITSVQRLKIFFKQNKFDYYYIAHPLNALEFHLAQGINKSVIITEHGSHTAYNIIYKNIKKWLYPKAKIYVVPTITDTKLYKDMGLPATYIPHFRSELNYFKAERVGNTVLTVGRFTEVKQQMLLLKVWQSIILEKPNLDWRLKLVGQGELQSQLETFIATNNLEKSIQILPPTKEIASYYQDASFFVLTSSSEGFGMVLLEAISFGLPCVSFDCPSGPRDVIKNNINGMLIEQNNVAEFKNAMLRLMEDRAMLDKFGEQAYRDSFDWADEQILDKWHNVLTK